MSVSHHLSKRIALIVGALAVLLGVTAGALWWSTTQEQTATADLAAAPVASGTSAAIDERYLLKLDKLNISAPIILDVPGTDEKAYLRAIEDGVAHYAGTAKFGEKGNAFIFGHSSYFKNKPGNYKEVFKNLDQLAVGETVTIQKGTELLAYKISRSAIISDDDLSVLDQPKDKEMVTIMTCWPPGTIAKRYIIQADRISDNS